MKFFDWFKKPRSPKDPNARDYRTFWMILVLLIVVGYLIFIFSRSMWRNYEINRELLSLETEIERIRIRQDYLKNLITYYQTRSYAEKEARSKLGLKKEGETVLALPRANQAKEKVEIIEEDTQAKEMSNVQKWWKFFFRN